MDWTLCFMCRESKNDRPRSTTEGLNSFKGRLAKLHEIGGIKFEHVVLCYTTRLTLFPMGSGYPLFPMGGNIAPCLKPTKMVKKGWGLV